jgi:invasion protein IalB
MVLVGAAALTAQAKPPQTSAPAAPPVTPPPPESNWITRCTSKTRAGALECAIEQSVIKTDTRQVVVLLRIRIPAETRAPVLLAQLPLGLYVPAHVIVHVDDRKVTEWPIQTCDASGCYASGPLAAELLAQLQAGKSLKFSFQNLARETIDVTMPLAGFAAAYDSIK